MRSQPYLEPMSTSQMVRDAGLDAVIGMYPVVHRLRSTVVAPWASSRRGDPAVRAPKRVLLYGVPGSGTTFIAHRLADELNELGGVSAIVLEDVDADVARDAHEFTAMLNGDETRDVVLIGVSHAPWSLPRTLIGEGGFERMAFVSPPDWDARRFRMWELPVGQRLDAAALDEIVMATEGWSGADLCGLGASASAASPSVMVETILAEARAQPATSTAWLGEARAMIRTLDTQERIDDLIGYLQRYRLL